MAVVQVTEKYFDIVLTSNAFQNHFPSNTVSHFRAKLPVTLMFPPNVPYRVALSKLSFINSINNIGVGANTKLWINDNSVNPVEIHMPDVSIDNIDVFIAFLLAQLKAADATLFPSSDTPILSIQKFPTLIRETRSISRNNVSNDMQSDQPRTLQVSIYTEKQESYDKLINIRDSLCRILFNFSQEPCDAYMRFAAFMRHELNNLTDLLSKAFDHETLWNQYQQAGVIQEPYPHLFLKLILNWFLLCYSTYVEPFLIDSAFSQTQESEDRALEFALHIQDQCKRTYFIRHPELKKQYHKETKFVINNDKYREFVAPFQALKNLDVPFSIPHDFPKSEIVHNHTIEMLRTVCTNRIA